MKRNPAPTRKRAQSSPPPLTDPRFAALLMFVAGLSPDDRDEDATELARIAHDAARILDVPDASAAFDQRVGHVNVHDCVKDSLRRDYSDDDEYCRKHRAIIAGIIDRPDDTLTADAEYVDDVLNGAIFDAFSRGAAVMYLILNGGAR